jgi:hypothetical protein
MTGRRRGRTSIQKRHRDALRVRRYAEPQHLRHGVRWVSLSMLRLELVYTHNVRLVAVEST